MAWGSANGNAVPPPFARAIASCISQALGVESERPEAPVVLGDPAFLQWNMSEASEFFGVPNPIRKRDRKSGARKRKQHEIEAQSDTPQIEMCFA